METPVHAIAGTAALTVALALAAGAMAQAVARHMRIPGIVLLLATGMLLGPDGLGIVRPEALGDALPSIVGFCVAVILFEGGMNLKVSRLRRQGHVVRRLVTVGGLVTLLGGALAARGVMGWDWRTAFLFGSLVIVTGPTVITPLVRRIRIRRRLQTILEAEGVLIDAVGAVVAVVALEVALEPTLHGTTAGFANLASRFGIGIALGAVAGFLIGFALKVPHLVPEGLENIAVLSLVVALYQVAHMMAAESGIVAVVVAGLVVGNMEVRALRHLMDFKEQLTVLLIGLLFVLLAADVRLADVVGLGWAGVVTVALLVFVVRPVNIAACTAGSTLTLPERGLLAWIAPRGIVAAAVASLFASELDRLGVAGGDELRAMVFLVIGVTVALQGITMGPVASMLGVRRARDAGWIILGANGLAIAVAEALRRWDVGTVLLESNPDRVQHAQERDLAVVYGNGLEETVLLRAEPEIRSGGIGVTPNEEANLLFSRRLREEFDCPEGYVALTRVGGHLTPEMVEEADCDLLFGEARDLSLWLFWLDRGRAVLQTWRKKRDADHEDEAGRGRQMVLPLVRRRGGQVAPVGELESHVDDEMIFAVDGTARDDAEAFLRERGWIRISSREEETIVATGRPPEGEGSGGAPQRPFTGPGT